MNKYLDNIFSHENKTVLITGATGQLGSIFCEAYISAGAKVIGWDINKPNRAIEGVHYFDVDIANKSEVDLAMQKSFNIHGTIDVLINNAGVSTFEPFENRPEPKIDWVMDVNIKGTFLCIQSFVNFFDHNKMTAANIVNIGSFYGVISPDFRIYSDGDRKNSEIYGATKAGVIQMSKYFAVHLADRNIRVNAISPGGIFNPDQPQGKDFVDKYSFRCPMKRMASADEMVGAILYLSSNAASYTTGQNIVIDGGMSCW
jgi:NAD(P)-dependent dehydrogenase (short-subunit alcohol dehydrogenase family)